MIDLNIVEEYLKIIKMSLMVMKKALENLKIINDTSNNHPIKTKFISEIERDILIGIFQINICINHIRHNNISKLKKKVIDFSHDFEAKDRKMQKLENMLNFIQENKEI